MLSITFGDRFKAILEKSTCYYNYSVKFYDAFAQKYTISGYISDASNGKMLIGVNINDTNSYVRQLNLKSKTTLVNLRAGVSQFLP